MSHSFDATLTAFPALRTLSERSQTQLRATLRTRTVDPRQPLLSRGDEAGGVFLVQEGDLRVFHLTAAGRESTLYWIAPGESCILALNCVFSTLPYPAWVESGETKTTFSVVPGTVYRELFEREPGIQAFTFDALSGRTFQLMGLLGEALSLGLEDRMLRLLLRLAGDGARVEVTQEKLANHLGTAREVVSRIVRHLVARGVIRSGRGTIEIVDRAALEADLQD